MSIIIGCSEKDDRYTIEKWRMGDFFLTEVMESLIVINKEEIVGLRDLLLKEFPLETEIEDLQEKVEAITKVTNEWLETKSQ